MARFHEPAAGVRLEVWRGQPEGLSGEALDLSATVPLATAPLAAHGRELSGEVEFWPESGRPFYYVAVTGVTRAETRPAGLAGGRTLAVARDATAVVPGDRP